MYTQKIVDLFKTHKFDYEDKGEYELRLVSGCIFVVGPNGAGKSTLFRQIEDAMPISRTSDNNLLVYHYYNRDNDTEFGDYVETRVREIVNEAKASLYDPNMQVIILIDDLDLGISVDKLHKYSKFFEEIDKDCPEGVSILVSTNNFELARTLPGRCLDPRNGTYCALTNYDKYVKFICQYFDYYHPAKENN